MNHTALINALERFGRFLPAVVEKLPPEDARWRPGEGHWSILEVVMHLADEEGEDFRTRLRLTLEEATGPWPKIDPQGWAVKRRYNEADVHDAVTRFAKERAESVKWLRSLNVSDWSVAHQHARFGPIRAGDILAAWAAHDALHLKQISKRLYQLANRDGEGYSTRYAGEWSA